MGNELKSYLASYTLIQEVNISDESLLLNDLNLDSISFVEFVVYFEERANLKIDFSKLAFNLFEVRNKVYSQLSYLDLKSALNDQID